MPKGYWIVRVSVKNAERYPEYLAAARPAFERMSGPGSATMAIVPPSNNAPVATRSPMTAAVVVAPAARQRSSGGPSSPATRRASPSAARSTDQASSPK